MLSLAKRPNRIVAFVLATSAPLLVAAALAIARLYSGEQTAIENALHARAETLLATVDFELTGEAASLQALALSPTLREGDLDAFFDVAVRALDFNPHWSSVAVASPDGSMRLLDTRHGRGWQGPASEPAAITAAADTRRVVFGPALPNAANGGQSFRIAVPVIVEDTVTHVLTASLTPESMADAFYRPHDGEWIASVLDSDKTVVATTLQPAQMIGRRSNLVDRALPGDVGSGLDMTGRSRAFVFLQSPVTGWWAGAIMPSEALYAPLRRAAIDTAVLALIAGAIIIGLTLYLARRSEQEAQRAEAARAADLERSVRITSSALQAAEVASAEKSYFLAAVSHDLRQPLQVVQSAVRLLSREVGGSSTRLLNNIEAAVRSSSSLLNALLDITRIESGAIHPNLHVVNLAELISTAANEVRADALAKGLDLRTVPSSRAVCTDPVLLASILRNFLTNAVRYTQKGKVLLGCRRRADNVRIEVWDTGIGIPEAECANIFRAFRQLANEERDRHKGYGLGLAVVQKLAALLDHPIGVRSTPGRGSVFWIDVPSTTARVLGEMPATAEPPAGRTHVLIVEDDTIQSMTLAEMLADWGIQSSVATSPAEALDRARERRPDLMLVDFRLRDADGLKVIQDVRDAVGPVPAIMVSGEIALREPLSRMEIPLLVKPYTPEQLLATINTRLHAAA